MKVFVVRGDCGEYSDFRTWEVRAFTDEARANALRADLEAWCAEHKVARGLPREVLMGPAAYPRPTACPIDPSFETDYTGTSYEVWSIEAEQ